MVRRYMLSKLNYEIYYIYLYIYKNSHFKEMILFCRDANGQMSASRDWDETYRYNNCQEQDLNPWPSSGDQKSLISGRSPCPQRPLCLSPQLGMTVKTGSSAESLQLIRKQIHRRFEKCTILLALACPRLLCPSYCIIMNKLLIKGCGFNKKCLTKWAIAHLIILFSHSHYHLPRWYVGSAGGDMWGNQCAGL